MVASPSLALWERRMRRRQWGKGVGLGEGEGEESLRAVGACGCYNPSLQSSPLIQGERRGVAGGVGSHAAPTELGLILDEIL